MNVCNLRSVPRPVPINKYPTNNNIFRYNFQLTLHTAHCLLNSIFTIRSHETLFYIKLKLNSEADVQLSLCAAD